MPHGPTYFPGKGCCIYCRATDRKLTDEHIVPYALGGQHVIRQASCLVCANVTKRFEQDVARGMWGDARAAFGERSRRKKDRPSHLRMRHPDTPRPGVDVPVEQYPGGMVFYRMGVAGVLLGDVESHDTSPNWRLVMTGDDQRWKEFQARHGWGPVLSFQHQPTSFGRLLAKIGYCQALSDFDLDDFDAASLPFIMGAKANVSYIVGESIGNAPPVPGLGYALGTVLLGSPTSAHVVASVRLYANLGAPSYHVAVGHVSGANAVQRAAAKLAPENVRLAK